MNPATIAEMAYKRWEARGRPEGQSEYFWLWAERDYNRLSRVWYEGEYEFISEAEAQKLVAEHSCTLNLR